MSNSPTQTVKSGSAMVGARIIARHAGTPITVGQALDLLATGATATITTPEGWTVHVTAETYGPNSDWEDIPLTVTVRTIKSGGAA